MSILKEARAALATISNLDDKEILNAEALSDLFSDIKPVPYHISPNRIFSQPQNQNQFLFMNHSR